MTDLTTNTTIGGGGNNATEQTGGTVVSGVGLFVSAGGKASNVAVAGGGYMDVYSQGNSVSAILSGDNATDSAGTATLNVSAGGSASYTSAGSNANVVVYAGGTTDYDLMTSGGQEIVSGTANNLTVSTNAHAYLSAGGTGSNWISEDGGWVGVYNGATLNGITVKGAASYADISGGTVNNASAINNGTLIVENGVTLSGARALLGGVINVNAGGATDSSTLGTGGVETVSVGGSALGTQLTEQDATLNIYGTAASRPASGTISAIATTVSAGTVNVYAGGSLDDAVIQSGIVTLSGGSATNISATNGSGGINVLQDGVLTSAQIASGGYVHISAGGQAIGDTITSNGTEYVDNGGSSLSAQILTSNANIIVSSGGTATDATIVSGYATVYDSGVMNGGSITSGIITVSGGAVSSIVASNGGGFDVSGGVVSSITLSTGGFINLYDGGEADNIRGIGTNLSSGNGGVNISGGTLKGATFQDGSTLSAVGGTLQDVTFNSNGYGFASSATLTDTHINQDGNLVIYEGARTSNTVVDGGGVSGAAFEAVSAGGSSISATIQNGGALYANAAGTLVNPTAEAGGIVVVHDGGTISAATISDAAILTVESGGTISGTVALANGGKAIIYPDGGGIINLGGDDNIGLVVSGLSSDLASDIVVSTEIDDFTGTAIGNSDGIELAGLKASDVTAVTAAGDQAVLMLTNGKTVTLNIKGAGSIGYNISQTQDGSLLYEVCFLSGSMIRTAEGDVAVEDIQIGDEVIAFDWKNNMDVTRSIVWVGKAHVNVRHGLPDDEAGWPVRILKNAIADGVPYKDMLITAEHCLFFKDRFVPVRMLVNGVSIFYDKSITSYDYYHVETEQHSVITADGMLTESYLDTGNRSSFRQEGKIAALRGAVKSWEDDAGAPLGVERSFVEPLFRALEWRKDKVSAEQVHVAPELTCDLDLHLVTETGAVVLPMRKTVNQYSFMLPPDTQSVRIVSRASRPSDVIGPFVDDRRLMGVAVADVHLLCAKKSVEITSHLQTEKPEGWHATDWTDCAWTNGDAELPLEDHLTHGKIGILSMTIRAAGPYVVTNQITTKSAKSA